MFTIGNVHVSSRAILAPMAGVTDFPFRVLNRRFGCEFAFTEMINVRSLSSKSKKTRHMLHSDTSDTPRGIQILGAKEEYILKGLEVLREFPFDILDFNAACPERKVVVRGEGAALMKDPGRLHALLKLLVRESPVPVTVKIRAGWDDALLTAVEAGRAAQDAGVRAVFIHGRTKMQGYHGSVRYAVIKEVKKALSIPVIGSGDVFSAELAVRMLEETGCDAVLVARGSLGNPWIFEEIRGLLEKGCLIPRPGKNRVLDTMLAHLAMCVDFYGPRSGVVIFRKFFSWYTKGFRRVRPLREQACRAKTPGAMRQVIEACRDAREEELSVTCEAGV